MFDKISSKSLKRVLALKYIVQLLGVPFVMGVSVLIIIVIAEIFISGFYNAIKVFFVLELSN